MLEKNIALWSLKQEYRAYPMTFDFYYLGTKTRVSVFADLTSQWEASVTPLKNVQFNDINLNELCANTEITISSKSLKLLVEKVELTIDLIDTLEKFVKELLNKEYIHLFIKWSSLRSITTTEKENVKNADPSII